MYKLFLLIFLIGCGNNPSLINEAVAKVKQKQEIDILCRKYGKIFNEKTLVENNEDNKVCIFINSETFFSLQELRVMDYTYDRTQKIDCE